MKATSIKTEIYLKFLRYKYMPYYTTFKTFLLVIGIIAFFVAIYLIRAIQTGEMCNLI
jgi:hypothetical protein